MNLSIFYSLSFLKASKIILSLSYILESLKTDEEKEKIKAQLKELYDSI
jgi:hypothetical protein